ncbi:MAG: MaoC/PaaZ C-terminal domain-containing protein, partial [Alphaproteobacteria bacterium]
MFHCYLDDFSEGSTFETEGKTVSEAEILEFALKYDPQPFHMDVEAAKEGPFGGL